MYNKVFPLLIVLLCIIVIASSVPVPAVQLYNDPAFLDAEIRRIRAGKAGDPIKPPVIRGKLLMHAVSSESVSEEDDGEEGNVEGDEDEYYDSEEIDVTCATGKGWHMRGQRCVPLQCIGGSSMRDFNTGECLHSQGGGFGRYRPYSQWNSLNHVYRTHPAQKTISRGMLSLLRRG